jgi:hypothetical protein
MLPICAAARKEKSRRQRLKIVTRSRRPRLPPRRAHVMPQGSGGGHGTASLPGRAAARFGIDPAGEDDGARHDRRSSCSSRSLPGGKRRFPRLISRNWTATFSAKGTGHGSGEASRYALLFLGVMALAGVHFARWATRRGKFVSEQEHHAEILVASPLTVPCLARPVRPFGDKVGWKGDLLALHAWQE